MAFSPVLPLPRLPSVILSLVHGVHTVFGDGAVLRRVWLSVYKLSAKNEGIINYHNKQANTIQSILYASVHGERCIKLIAHDQIKCLPTKGEPKCLALIHLCATINSIIIMHIVVVTVALSFCQEAVHQCH